MGDNIKMETNIQLSTYEAMHSLDADFSFNNAGVCVQFWGRVKHFKNALKEFSFLEGGDIISLQTSEKFPKLSFVFSKPNHARYHAVKFNDNIEDFVVKHISDAKASFTVESMRLAFSRITSDSLLCIVTLNNDGALSVKLMHEEKLFLAESIILRQEDSDDDF